MDGPGQMAQQRQASVIRRKICAARDGADPRVVSPVRALRLALARAADTLLDLPLVVATVEQCRIEAAEVETALGADGLFVLLDGAAGARAAMRLCPGFLAALIEVQTTGRVRPGEPRPRAPTRTDAAMVAPLVDALLAGFDEGMGADGAAPAPRGFHYGDRVEDARALSLLMRAAEFDFFRLTVDLGPGLRTGRLDLLLPSAPSAPAPDGAPAAAGARRGGDARAPEDMATVALAAPVALDAVVARIRLPLSDAMALAPGQRLGIAADSLGQVRLMGAGGHVAAQGRLGRRGGRRALRLSGTGAPGGDGAARTAGPPGASASAGGAPAPPPDRAAAPNAPAPAVPGAQAPGGQEPTAQAPGAAGAEGAPAGGGPGAAEPATPGDGPGGTTLSPTSG